MDDSQLVHFYRQYMQQVQNLSLPPAKLLLEPDVQDQVYKYFFDGPLKGPATYQRKVLKQILSLIERVINDPDEHVGLNAHNFAAWCSSGLLLVYPSMLLTSCTTRPSQTNSWNTWAISQLSPKTTQQ